MSEVFKKHKIPIIVSLAVIGALISVGINSFIFRQGLLTSGESQPLTGAAVSGKIPPNKKLPRPHGRPVEETAPPVVKMKGITPGDDIVVPRSHFQKNILPLRDTTTLFYPPDQDGVDVCKDVASWVVEAMSLDKDMVKLGRSKIRKEWEKYLTTLKTSQWESPWFEGMRTNFWQYTGLDSPNWGKKVADENLTITQNVVETRPLEHSEISAYWGEKKYAAMFWPQVMLGLSVCKVTTSKNTNVAGESPEKAKSEEQQWAVAVNTKTGDKKNWEVEGIWLM